MRYWITVVSKDHIARGIAGGFMQANHGKQGPLKRMGADDWVIFYSPKETYGGNDTLQSFTAIGQVADNNVYQQKMSDDFTPYRRNMKFSLFKEVPIKQIIEQLDFIPNKKSWGYTFRFGFLEIKEHDFRLIYSEMVT